MPKIVTVSADTHRRLKEAALPGSDLNNSPGAVRHADGSVSFPLADESLERLAKVSDDPETAIRALLGCKAN